MTVYPYINRISFQTQVEGLARARKISDSRRRSRYNGSNRYKKRKARSTEKAQLFRKSRNEIAKFGAIHLDCDDHYPHFIIISPQAVDAKEVEHDGAISDSGFGESIAANKVSAHHDPFGSYDKGAVTETADAP